MRIDLGEIFARDSGVPLCQLSLVDETASRSSLLAEVHSLRAQLSDIDAHTWLLYSEDSHRFAIGLVALLSLGKKVLVCASKKQQWIAQFSGDFDGVLTDEDLIFPGKVLLGLRPSGASQPVASPAAAIGFSGQETIVFFTSGSTGSPKAIVKSFEQILNEVETLEDCFGRELQHATVLATVSHQHIYGLLFKILWPMLCGRSWFNDQIEYPEQIVAAQKKLNSISIVSSPAFLSRLDKRLSPVRSLRIFSSGGPLSFSASQATLVALGAIPTEVYGSTETGGVAWRQRESEGLSWHLFKGVSLQAVRGGVELNSPHIPSQQTYLLDDELEILADGTFLLKGRKDRIVKLAEKRVSLTEIERHCESQDTIERCVALPISIFRKVSSQADGTALANTLAERECLGCVIVLSRKGRDALDLYGLRALKRRWKRSLVERYERVMVPRKWRVVAEMPVNAQGKIDADDLKRLFIEQSSVSESNTVNEQLELPQILSEEAFEDGIVLTLAITDQLHAFDGHFESEPILPGVVQIQWAIALARQCLGDKLPLGVETLHSVKFHHVIRPSCEVHLTLALSSTRLQFLFSSGQIKHSTGKIDYKL